MESSLGIKINDHHPLSQEQYKQQQQHHQQQQQQQQQTKLTSDDPKRTKQVGLKDIELFFANSSFNSCQATDELIRSIEQSQDDSLARRALDLYQRHLSTLEKPWDHVTFMYGLGLIYMHFNAYNWAIKSFREVIYVQPSFPRSRDIHTRLGLIFKATGRYKLSEKHFNLAINDSRPDCGTSTKLELRFLLAHLHELQGKLKQACDEYEKLLQENDLPPSLSANIHRQLGLIYYKAGTKDSIENSNSTTQVSRNRKDNMFNRQNTPLFDPQKIESALNHLNTSFRTDHDFQTSYYLGRCLTNAGRFQDAFASYRSVIDRDESTADTWCSIGVLYHRQNQPWDALQAYIRSVQFDKKHSTAWMNLGILYESHNQFRDALKCYQHALRSGSNGIDRSLQARIKYIQKQLADIEAIASNTGKQKLNSDKLLSLEDLWNFESRLSSEASLTPSNSRSAPRIAQQTDSRLHPNTIKPSSPDERANNHPSEHSLKQDMNATLMDVDQVRPKQLADDPKTMNNCDDLVNKASVNSYCKNDMIISKSENDSIPQLQSNSIHQSKPLINQQNGLPTDCKPNLVPETDQKSNTHSQETKEFCFNQVLTNGASKDSGISSDSSTYTDCALVPSQNTDIISSSNTYLTAEKVIEACRNLPRPTKIDINLLGDNGKPPCTFPRSPPYPPLPQDRLFLVAPSVFLETKKELTSRKLQDFCQSGPISIVRNFATVQKLDLGLFSTKTLVESNPDYQIDIVSHLSLNNVGNSDEDVTPNPWSCERQKTTSTISRYASYQFASLKESLQEERDSKPNKQQNLTKESETDSNESMAANLINNKKNNGLNPGSSSSFTTTTTNIPDSHNHVHHHQTTATNPNQKSPGPVAKKMKKQQEATKIKYVRGANHIDLSDEKRWRPQLSELNKLPYYLRCVSASNMLTHLGTMVPGVNTISMGMHVPGCKFVGSTSPNKFCPIVINTGPGDYEWHAISDEHEKILTKLCNKYGFEIDEGNWWPRINDLLHHNVPIYRFTQRPGDLVWVNQGTFYWVQATGWTNSIYWHVGSLCAKQYRLASERSEINKLLLRKSEVPMVQMTWNIVMNINIIADDELFKLMSDVMRRSLRYCCLIRELVDDLRKDIKVSSDEPNPRKSKYCTLCDVEIFNISFKLRGTDSVHCVECARRFDGHLTNYKIRQDYDFDLLCKLYDNFIDTRRKFKARQQQQMRLKQQQQQQQQQQEQQQPRPHEQPT